MITALLVDDESAAIARLSEMLESFPDIEVIGTARNVADAERFLRLRTPTVVFLDMKMPGRLGLELIGSLSPLTSVIFVTANESFAVAAFDHGAVDFLLKPFNRDRLEAAIRRLRDLAPTLSPDDAATMVADQGDQSALAGVVHDGKLQLDSRFTISSERGRSVERVSVAEIVWIRAVENYTHVLVRARTPALIRRRLAEWAAILPEPPFHRLDRSLIVNVDGLIRTQRQSRDQTVLFFAGLQEPLPIGRTATLRLLDLIDG